MTRVLVVEDDRSVGAAIQMILSREGCETVHASNADVGISAFESCRFDLAIVDIFLPDISGLRIIAEFRRQAPAIPIIAMSGFIFRGSMDPALDLSTMALRAGAGACLRKPFASRQLVAAVHMSLAPAFPVLAS